MEIDKNMFNDQDFYNWAFGGPLAIDHEMIEKCLRKLYELYLKERLLIDSKNEVQ